MHKLFGGLLSRPRSLAACILAALAVGSARQASAGAYTDPPPRASEVSRALGARALTAPLIQRECIGGDAVDGDPPVSARVTVSGDGTVDRTMGVWRLSNPVGGGPPPFALVEFPIVNGVVARRPAFISVMEMAPFDPPLLTPTASIVLLVDGVEKTRRPWRLFATQMAMVNAGGKRPTALVGIVPFNSDRADGTPDAGLASLLDEIGSGSARTLEVRLIGARGRMINSGTFPLAIPPVLTPVIFDAALKDAAAKAAAPAHCARLTGRAP